MRHIITISGKDSLATLIWQRELDPSLPYEFVFNDVRAELPETYEWLDTVEHKLGIEIKRIGLSLTDIIAQRGILPTPRIRFCTSDAKIRPMDRFIGKDKAIVYFGLRADEPARIGAIESNKLTPRYPLRDAGIGLATVYAIVGKYDLMPPAFFWERLYREVVRQYGEPVGWPDWMRARIFAGRSRPNCSFCFFQRRYEWVWLLETHPDLFAQAEKIEAETGNGPELRRSTGSQWIAEGYALSKIRQNAEMLFEKRVKAVGKLITAAAQSDLFADALDEMDAAQTSCGLLCGK